METWSLVGALRPWGWGRGTSPSSQSSYTNHSNCCTHTSLGSLFCLGFSNSSVGALDFHLTGTPRHAISQKPPELICVTNDLKHRSIQWTGIQYHPEDGLINSLLFLAGFVPLPVLSSIFTISPRHPTLNTCYTSTFSFNLPLLLWPAFSPPLSLTTWSHLDFYED